jgi:hypothetical protein
MRKKMAYVSANFGFLSQSLTFFNQKHDGIRDKLNRSNGLEADAEKQKLPHVSARMKGSK